MTTTEKYQRRIGKLTKKLERVEHELGAERSLRRALSEMRFDPVQDRIKLRNLRRAFTIHSMKTKDV